MSKQTIGWVNELELNMFRYGTKRIEKKIIKASKDKKPSKVKLPKDMQKKLREMEK
jgi:hypothetical protein